MRRSFAREAGGPARPYTESRLRARRVAVVKACRVRDHVDSVVWWAHQDSNLGQTGYEPAALPLSYGPDQDGASAAGLLRALEKRAQPPAA